MARTYFPFFTAADTTLGGVGTTAAPVTSAVASAEFLAIRSSNSATSGNSYTARFHQKVIGAGGAGAAVRGYGYAYGAAAANVYGGEFTAEIHSSSGSAVTGLLAGLRSVCSVQGTASGTLAALDLEFDVLTNKSATVVANSFIRVGSVGSGTGCNALFNIATAKGTTSAITLSTTDHATLTADTGIRILINGVAHWLLATTHAPAAS